MSDAAKFAKAVLLRKPAETPISKVTVTPAEEQAIASKIPDALIESAFSAAVSYTEAINGLKNRSTSWSIIKLYYTCYYAIKSLNLHNGILPFNDGKKERMYDSKTKSFSNGGTSSHVWNWRSLRSYIRSSSMWYISEDSENCYNSLKSYRESVNYNGKFPEPLLHKCVVGICPDLERKFRAYRDDVDFTYTYLDDHNAIAYPTKLLFFLDERLKIAGYSLSADQIKYIKANWKFKDRCPIA